MPLLDTGYHHYDDTYRGVWYRRAVISGAGIRILLATPWVKRIVGFAWILCLVQVAVLFFVGQLLVPDSLAFELIGRMGRGERNFFGGFTDWLREHPEVSVHTVYNFLFFQYSTFLSLLGFVVLSVVVPQMVTVDFSSRALLVYSSKALNRFDYLLGKFGIAFGILACIWLGPLLAAWLLGNLLSPDWTFMLHSSRALLNMVCYVGVSMITMSVIALAVSACSAKEKGSTALWIGVWIFGGMFGKIGSFTQPWLQNISLSHNLHQLAVWSFNLKRDMIAAGEVIPAIGQAFRQLERMPGFRRPPVIGEIVNEPALQGALVGLILMLGIAALIISRRVRPEST